MKPLLWSCSYPQTYLIEIRFSHFLTAAVNQLELSRVGILGGGNCRFWLLLVWNGSLLEDRFPTLP